MTAFSLTSLAAPHAVGVCAGCKDDIAVVDGYCPACAELNAAYEARLRAHLESMADAELANFSEAVERLALVSSTELGSALKAAFPAVGVVVFDGIIAKIGEEVSKLPSAAEETAPARGDCASRAVEELAEALAEMPRAVAVAAAGLFLAGFWGLVAWALFGR